MNSVSVTLTADSLAPLLLSIPEGLWQELNC